MNALILIDLQNDFFPGGALPVETAPEILPALTDLLQKPFELVIATKDWHPADHMCFAKNHGKKPGEIVLIENIEQILWPVHCVQGTLGADFFSGWDTKKIKKIVQKGTDKWIDSYSAFFDNGQKKSTGLADFLRAHHVDSVYIAGLATDYCVKYSVLDALKLGFKTYVVTDACRGINLKAEDSQQALNDMQKAGAILVTSKQIAIP